MKKTLAAAALSLSFFSASAAIAPKLVIVAMFAPEAKLWLERLGPWQATKVPGLSPDYPTVQCNRQQVCVMTTGMGHSNAAASTMALAFSPAFDLRRSYVLVAGIAGINPELGTLGSVAWARYLVARSRRWTTAPRCFSSTRRCFKRRWPCRARCR